MVRKEVSNEGEWKNIKWNSTILGGLGQEDWKGKSSTWEHILIVLIIVWSLKFHTRNQPVNNELGEEPKNIKHAATQGSSSEWEAFSNYASHLEGISCVNIK